MNYGHKSREADDLLRAWLDASGTPLGGRLPSERQLAQELGIHHSVMNRAMARVLAEGRVERRGYKLFYSGVHSPDDRQGPCDLVILKRARRLSSIRKVAQELRFPLREHLAESAEEWKEHLVKLNGPATESVILIPPYGGEWEEWEPAAKKLLRKGVPVICVGQRLPGLSSVASDHGLEKIITHLSSLGHVELALLVASPWTSAIKKISQRWTELCQLYASHSSGGRVVHQNSSHMLKEDLAALAAKLNADWKSVTAMVISTDDDLPIQRLLDFLRRQKIPVPERLSLISLIDHPPLRTAVPPIGAALEDRALEHEAACLLVRRALRKRDRLGLLVPRTEIDIALDIQERSSLIRIPPRSKPDDLHQGRTVKPFSSPTAPGFALDQEDPDLAGKIPYELSRDAVASSFRSLSLAGQVNRPLNFRRGWLGDLPLSSLSPGWQKFHGVPFQILGRPSRRDRGAIVFQSLRNRTGGTAKLPSKVRIPVNAPAKAIYILHGCGYVKYRARFGSYRFFGKKKELEAIPLVALGRPQSGAQTWELAEAILEANIQDWWPDYPHGNFRHARMVPLPHSRTSGPIRGHVFLYTLQWINPFPELSVSHIEIETDPDQSATLGVLAISLLKP